MEFGIRLVWFGLALLPNCLIFSTAQRECARSYRVVLLEQSGGRQQIILGLFDICSPLVLALSIFDSVQLNRTIALPAAFSLHAYFPERKKRTRRFCRRLLSEETTCTRSTPQMGGLSLLIVGGNTPMRSN